jgi:hypothetical protein
MNTGGPAFPLVTPRIGEPINDHLVAQGITMRDYFAAKVLPSLYADYVQELRSDGERVKIGSPNDPGVSAECLTRECYAIADAMLKARME